MMADKAVALDPANKTLQENRERFRKDAGAPHAYVEALRAQGARALAEFNAVQ